MNKPETITIVGAGLVGSLLAVILGKRGYRVQVLEKRADSRGTQVSAGRSINLALAERGIHGLRQAGLMDKVEPLLIPMSGRVIHSVHGETDFLSYGQRPAEVIYSVSRGGLNELMMSAAEQSRQVDILFEHDLESIDFDSGMIEVRDHKGQLQSFETELLIGCDGGGSQVRNSLISHVGGVDNSELLDHCYKELTLPAGKDGSHQIDREALHIWPRGGYMLIALPNLDGSFTVTLFLQEKGAPSFESLSDQAAVEAFFNEQFPDVVQLLPDLATEFFKNPTGILGTVRCSPWIFENRVLMVGDASHGIVPFHGQGMNAGFEDCVLLDDLLDQFDDDWSSVLKEFNSSRKTDSDAIADMALENYITMRDSVMDPKFGLKKELGFKLELKYPDRFIPRYSMVMFHRIPFAEVIRRGATQAEILNELIQGCESIDDVDMNRASELIQSRL